MLENDVETSLERDRALTSRALREREEIANERQRFELLREKVYLGLELLVLAIALLLAIVLYLQGKEAAALIFLGGGASFGGIAALLHHRSDAAPE